ncbi:hypothetical protein TSOC_004913 [Tetrabaena socialis]|uniref:von Hippel-Lindau disease tumour suppressor beta domain-containing protein n=1 Tax=Tetrabaena socialis TaxID=47790 RepID=A0A2J8A7L2_9CHLO|nr:hypothetical protein TSOC_004913 [Tetrabaena socialis]|eukprot:PNH08511.1 hypothetical protein TSOC_004913 [Tetrabaena socialis]
MEAQVPTCSWTDHTTAASKLSITNSSGGKVQAPPPGLVAAWGRYLLPREDVRLASEEAASGGPGSVPRHMFTPHAEDLKPSSPRFVPYALLFQQRWAAREPVLLVWLSYDGAETVYNVLEDGQEAQQDTYSTHVWELRDEDGRRLLQYAGPSAKVCVLPAGVSVVGGAPAAAGAGGPSEAD